MKPYTVAVALALLAPLAAGCAEEDEELHAAYPAAPVGYTPPPLTAAPAPPAPPTAVASGAPVSAPVEQPMGSVSSNGDTSGGDPQDAYADSDPSALSDFRSTLDPYGDWVEDPTYGSVWVPSESVVGADFTPYRTAGHWVYDDDYVWVSDYAWGWAPFHYGRWVYGGPVGWEWIPGRTYAGAWVSWRYGWDDWAYVGWAPLPPTWCWRGGVAVGLGYVPVAPYGFVATGNLFSPVVGSRLVVGAQVGVVGAHTRPWVPASPAVGGRVVARPGVGGPPPSALNMTTASVVRSSPADRGLIQARAYARPSTATALGARPVEVRPSGAPAAASFAPRATRTLGASGTAPASHFGGRLLGSGFSGSAASAAPMRSPSYSAGAPSSHPYFGYSHPASPSPGYSAGSAFHGSYYGGSSFHPSASAPHASSFGGFHGGGGGGGGGFHASGGGSHGGGGHGGGHR